MIKARKCEGLALALGVIMHSTCYRDVFNRKELMAAGCPGATEHGKAFGVVYAVLGRDMDLSRGAIPLYPPLHHHYPLPLTHPPPPQHPPPDPTPLAAPAPSPA